VFTKAYHKVGSNLTLSSHLCLGLLSGPFLSGFPTKILYAFLISPIYATSHAHFILLNLITLIIFSEAYQSTTSSQIQILQEKDILHEDDFDIVWSPYFKLKEFRSDVTYNDFWKLHYFPIRYNHFHNVKDATLNAWYVHGASGICSSCEGLQRTTEKIMQQGSPYLVNMDLVKKVFWITVTAV